MFRSVLLLLMCTTVAPMVMAKDAKIEEFKEGSYYKVGQLGIKKIKEQGGKLDITFRPIDEQFHWCPGIKTQKTKIATIVTFVRVKTSQNFSVDKQAKIGNRLIRSISISTNDLDVYVRNGPNRFKRIYKSPNSKGNIPEELTLKTKPTATKSSASGK